MTQALVPQKVESMGIQVLGRQPVTIFGEKGMQRAEVIEMRIAVPEPAIYAVGNRADFLSDYYDVLAREMGVSFGDPKILFEDDNVIKVELSAKYFNRSGHLIVDSVIYEIDCDLLFKESRLKWTPKPVWGRTKEGKPYQDKEALNEKIIKLQEQGFLIDKVIYDKNSVPINVERKLPPEAELEIWNNFLTLKKNKLQKAQTCARRTLTKRALGAKGIPIPVKDKEGKWKQDVAITLYSVNPVMGKAESVQSVSDIYDDEIPKDIIKEDDMPEPIINEDEDEGEPENIPAPKQAEPKPAPVSQEAQKKTNATYENGYKCQSCNKGMSDKVGNFSLKKYKKLYCFACQQNMEQEQEEPENEYSQEDEQ